MQPCATIRVYVLNLSTMKKLFILIVFLAAGTFVKAQNRETRDVGTFTKLAFRVPGKLYLKQGTPQKVELEGPSDVLKEIETELDGERLIIGKENKWRNWGWKDRE